MKKILLFIAIAFTVHSCFDSELVFEDQFVPVVEAYIFNDVLMSDVRVTSMIGFGDDSTGGTPICDVLIELKREGDIWPLLMDEADSMYNMNELMEITEGDSFLLQVTIDDEMLYASTVMPPNPPEISASATSITIPRVEDMRDFQDITMPDPVQYTWDNPDGRYLFFRIQNIESSEDAIMPDPPDDRPFERPGFSFQMDTEPTNGTNYELSARELTHYGTHEIIVYSINEEYVALYNSMNQDSRELNEPFSNIEGGLGIFTAFNSDTLWLEVVPG